jgi:hypothetical protein
MTNFLYGAVTFGRRDDTGACSTVEARSVEGARLVLLAAVQGDLATPALESIKDAFAKVAHASEGAVAKLVAAAPPPPYGAGVAVVVLAGARAFAAASGAARCYLERAGRLEELGTGAHDLSPGDAVVVASHARLPVGRAFFGADVGGPLDDEFHNNGLDDALEAALSKGGGGFVSVAAARAGAS